MHADKPVHLCALPFQCDAKDDPCARGSNGARYDYQVTGAPAVDLLKPGFGR
jgi:hypothetical protein